MRVRSADLYQYVTAGRANVEIDAYYNWLVYSRQVMQQLHTTKSTRFPVQGCVWNLLHNGKHSPPFFLDGLFDVTPR